MDMTARLLTNLGMVQECLGNYDEAIELGKRSMQICKRYDIYEQLEKNHSFMGSLYYSKGDLSNSIREYNLAIEVAGK